MQAILCGVVLVMLMALHQGSSAPAAPAGSASSEQDTALECSWSIVTFPARIIETPPIRMMLPNGTESIIPIPPRLQPEFRRTYEGHCQKKGQSCAEAIKADVDPCAKHQLVCCAEQLYEVGK